LTPFPYRFNGRLTVRGLGATFVSEVDPTLKPPAGVGGFVPYHKWSNVGGRYREYHEDARYDDRTMSIDWGGDPVVNAIHEQRMEVEFSLGFGFGKRIRSISSVERAGDRRVLKGLIRVWHDDVSIFRLVVDDDLIVRDALIDMDSFGFLKRFESSTEGTVVEDGFAFARTGRFRATLMGLRNPPVKLKDPFKPKVEDEFESDFRSAKFHLDDEEYELLTTMAVQPGTVVKDWMTGERYVVANDGRVTGARSIPYASGK
jgi:hypothetical protein